MKVLRQQEALVELCRATESWGIHFQIGPDSARYVSALKQAEAIKVAPWLASLDEITRFNVLWDGEGFLLFQSEAELSEVFRSTIDPEEASTYESPILSDFGSFRIYMLPCSPEGVLYNGNWLSKTLTIPDKAE